MLKCMIHTALTSSAKPGLLLCLSSSESRPAGPCPSPSVHFTEGRGGLVPDGAYRPIDSSAHLYINGGMMTEGTEERSRVWRIK